MMILVISLMTLDIHLAVLQSIHLTEMYASVNQWETHCIFMIPQETITWI